MEAVILIILCLVIISSANGFAVNCGGGSGHHINTVKASSSCFDDGDGVDVSSSISSTTRRSLVLGTLTIPSFWAATSLSHNTPAYAIKLRPDDAFANLVKARQELNTMSEYVPKRDWDGLRTYLTDDAINMNNYEANAQALLESKRLDAESKKDIGTIRRYGVGADVIIMYGGLKNEVNNEENDVTSAGEVGKYIRRTSDSLDEVIAICKSNGF